MRLQACLVRLGVLLVLVAVGVLGFGASAFAGPPAPTETKMELSGAGKKGADITVPAGTTVIDTVTVKGENVANVSESPLLRFSFEPPPGTSCGSEGAVNLEFFPNPVELDLGEFLRPGSYYIEARYTGNSFNAPSEAPCGSAIVTVPAKAVCTTNAGTIKLSPGLTSTPSAQTITIKGRLSHCTGEPFTAVAYSATLLQTEAVSCSTLRAARMSARRQSEPRESATGPSSYKWTPKTKPSKATGMLTMWLGETPGLEVSGTVEAGPHSPLGIYGEVSETFAGASTCGTKKAIKKGTFTGPAVSIG